MSEETMKRVMARALMTRSEAAKEDPTSPIAWEVGFGLAMQRHIDDEACRWLAGLGCHVYLANGEKCLGWQTPLAEVCDRCAAYRHVVKADSVNTAITEALSKGADDINPTLTP